MSTAITTAQKELRSMVERDDVQKAFRRVLGENGPAFIASMLTAVNTNDSLKFCDPLSVVNSAMLAATLDLPIEQNLGQAWLVPYKDHGVDKAQFQIGYKGLIQLAIRTGQYRVINASIIRNGMIVRENYLTGEVTVTGEPVNDEAIGYLAYIELNDGYHHAVYMTKEQVTNHAERYSKSFGNARSAWTTNFNDMALKTVIRKILTKYGIMSVKMTRAISADSTPMEQVDMSDAFKRDVVEGEVKQKQSAQRSVEQLTGEKPQRPYSPEYLCEKIRDWTHDFISSGQKATDAERKILASVLDKATGDKTRRYAICSYLTGTTSTKEMPDATVKALLNWLGVAKFDDVLSEAVKREIESLHAESLKSNGQIEMAMAEAA